MREGDMDNSRHLLNPSWMRTPKGAGLSTVSYPWCSFGFAFIPKTARNLYPEAEGDSEGGGSALSQFRNTG